jgi:hypothetical protein
MGSVIDYIECPNCGQEAYNDFYYKTGEEYTNCPDCGYHYSATYKRNDQGNLVTQDGSENYAFDNLILEMIELKPYAATRLKHYGGLGTYCGTVENEDQLDEFVDFCRSMDTIEFASTSRLVDGEIIKEIIVDNGPQVDSAGVTVEDR